MALRGPACARTRSSDLGVRRTLRGPRAGHPRRCGCRDPDNSRARGPCQPQQLDAPRRLGRALLWAGARSRAQSCAHHTLPAPASVQADSGLRRGTTAPAAAPAEVPVVAVPEPANRSLLPYSRENSSRDSPRAEILPNMEPACGRGLLRGEDGRSNSREKRATAGHQRQELPGTALLEGAKADPGKRWSSGEHLPRAPHRGRRGKCLVPRWKATVTNRVSGKSQRIFELPRQPSTRLAEPPISKKYCIKKRFWPESRCSLICSRTYGLLFGILTKSAPKVNISPALSLRFSTQTLLVVLNFLCAEESPWEFKNEESMDPQRV